MLIARFKYKSEEKYGIVDGENTYLLKGSVFSDKIFKTGDIIKTESIKFFAPIQPSKIICAGLNYKDHAEELKMALPQEPTLFMKPSTSVIGPGDEIRYPLQVKRLDYEAELAVVIKKRTKDVEPDEAATYILGYTCLNDVTARDLQKKDGQWTRAKSFDTFCPLGPYIATDINPDNLKVQLRVNDKVLQSSSTSNLIFKVKFLVSFVSKVMALLPGDVIATGTPKGVGPLSKGDEVCVDIEGIGTLRNRVS